MQQTHDDLPIKFLECLKKLKDLEYELDFMNAVNSKNQKIIQDISNELQKLYQEKSSFIEQIDTLQKTNSKNQKIIQDISN